MDTACQAGRTTPPCAFAVCEWRCSPERMIPMRSPSDSASSIECVVSSRVRLALRPEINSHTICLFIGSIPVVGSSRMTTPGLPIKEMATESRRFIPAQQQTRSSSSAIPLLAVPSTSQSPATHLFGQPFSLLASSAPKDGWYRQYRMVWRCVASSIS